MVEDTEAVGVIITLLKDKSSINHRKTAAALLCTARNTLMSQRVFSISRKEENTCCDITINGCG